MMTTAVIDTSVVVALADTHDKWHAHAVALRDALLASGIRQLFFDRESLRHEAVRGPLPGS